MPDIGPFAIQRTTEEIIELQRKNRLKAALGVIEDAMGMCTLSLSWLDPTNEFEYAVREKIASHRSNLDEVRYSLQRESK